jgi:hypothetical protein
VAFVILEICCAIFLFDEVSENSCIDFYLKEPGESFIKLLLYTVALSQINAVYAFAASGFIGVTI